MNVTYCSVPEKEKILVITTNIFHSNLAATKSERSGGGGGGENVFVFHPGKYVLLSLTILETC